MLVRQPASLVDVLDQPVGLVPVVEDIRAERQGKAEVELIPQRARMCILFFTDSYGLIRITQHPGPLRRPDLDEGPQIETRELHPPVGLPRIVQRENLPGLRARVEQVAEVEAGDRDVGVPVDAHIAVPGLCTFRQQAFGPLERMRDTALGDGARPHPPQPEQEALRVALAPGQLEDRGLVGSRFGRCPAP